MYLLTKFKLKKLLITLLSFVMILCLAFATACGDTDDGNDDDKTTTETEETLVDNQTLKNGDFEFLTNEDTKFPYASSISWTRSMDSDNTSATSSTISSGIIDTADAAYNKLKETERPSYKDGETVNYINPRTPYYYGLTDNKFVADDKDYKSYPNAEGTKVLMIANKTNEDGVGTAQKFKSSSNIVVPVEGYARVSIWVKTIDLKSASLPEGEYGAYIRLTNKAGSKEMKQLCYENINTKGEWVKYELYIVGTDLSTTTLTLTVGLGDGNSTFTKNYVEGFAYFDNAQVETFTKPEYYAMQDRGQSYDVVDADKENIFDLGSYVYEKNPTEKTEYSEELANKATIKQELNYRYVIGNPVTVEGDAPDYPDYIITNGYDLTGAGQNVLKAGYLNDIDTTAISDKLATVESDIGNANPYIAYMNFEKPSVASYFSDAITLPSKTYTYVTFYAKVEGLNLADKAKVEVYDVVANKYYTAFPSFDTKAIDDGNYGEWGFYKMMLYNPTDSETTYQVKFTFGNNSIKIIEDQWLLQKGYAIIADLKVAEVELEEGKAIYSLISNGNNFKTSLYGKYTSYVDPDDSTSTSNDSYAIYTDVQGAYDIATQPVTAINGYSFMGGTKGDYVTGIINSKYVNPNNTYGTNTENPYIINGLDTFKTLVDDGNTYAQAVVLDNIKSANTGYRSTKITVTAGTQKKISVKVKATGSAVANVYLVDLLGNPLKLDPIDVTLKSTVKADTHSTVDNWTNIVFYLSAGNEDISLRVEIWNGDKNSETGSQGAIFFENVLSSDLESIDNYNTDRESYRFDFSDIEGYKFDSKSHTRPNATLLETVDGEEVESVKTFKPQEIYAGNCIVKFADFNTIHCDDVIDNTTEEEEETTEEEGYTVSTDVALQISSIVIAIVLIAVMIVVVIRTQLKKRTKKQIKVKAFYDRNTRDQAMEKVSSKKKEITLASDEEDYDYEEAQAIEETQEEIIEETVEEVETTEELTEEPVIELPTEETTEEVTETTETEVSEEKTEE